MQAWPNRGEPPAAPAGGWNNESLNRQKKSDQSGLTQANKPPRNPGRFMILGRILLGPLLDVCLGVCLSFA